MNKDLCIEAYSFYKKTSSGIILFHVNTSYVVLFEDAVKFSELLGLEYCKQNSNNFNVCVFPEDDVLKVVSKLASLDVQFSLIEYKNPQTGVFEIPKVKHVIDEMNLDY